MDYPIVIHQWKDVELSIYLPTYIFICMKKTKQKNWHTTHKKQQKDYKILFPIRKKIWRNNMSSGLIESRTLELLCMRRIVKISRWTKRWSRPACWMIEKQDIFKLGWFLTSSWHLLLLSLTLKKDTFMKPFQKILQLELVQFSYFISTNLSRHFWLWNGKHTLEFVPCLWFYFIILLE